MRLDSLAVLAIFAVSARAHPGHQDLPLSPAEHQQHFRRAQLASKCAPRVEKAQLGRRLSKRGSSKLGKRNIPTSVLSAVSAQATGIMNKTCLTSPEVTEGPYFLHGDLLRTRIDEGQAGVPLTLDIGLMDIHTCEPLENHLVEIWHTNATGSYSYFTTAVLPPPPPHGPGGPGNHPPYGPPHGDFPPPPPGPSKPPIEDPYDDGTFCRGAYPSNKEGVVEFQTIYPGYYSGRTAHIHFAVRKDYEIADNGTIIASSGTVEHVGQLFFSEDLNTRVFSLPPYDLNTQRRTTNDQDGILQGVLRAGDWPFVEVSQLGEEVEEGLYAYITIGMDTTASHPLRSHAYLQPADLDPKVQKAAFEANGLEEWMPKAAETLLKGAEDAETTLKVEGGGRRWEEEREKAKENRFTVQW